MVWVQNCSLTTPTLCPAFLAGIVISHKDRCAPSTVFDPVSGNGVLVRFVNMISKAGMGRFLPCLRGGWVKRLPASVRAGLSYLTLLAVLWHWIATYWTGGHDSLAARAYLIEHRGIRRALLADPASNSYATCVGFEPSGTGNASRVPGLLPGPGYSWRGFTTSLTRNRQTMVTPPTNLIVRPTATNFTTPLQLSHRYNLPQLTMLVKLALERMAGMGLEPRLAT